jgi:hypothetical protein
MEPVNRDPYETASGLSRFATGLNQVEQPYGHGLRGNLPQSTGPRLARPTGGKTRPIINFNISRLIPTFTLIENLEFCNSPKRCKAVEVSQVFC